MMAITTSSSISVNPRRAVLDHGEARRMAKTPMIKLINMMMFISAERSRLNHYFVDQINND